VKGLEANLQAAEASRKESEGATQKHSLLYQRSVTAVKARVAALEGKLPATQPTQSTDPVDGHAAAAVQLLREEVD
jgi:hypothetical protein